jgi:hypothetical protein
MTYLDRLKTKISGNAPDPIATKATEAPFVPFVAPLTTPLRQISIGNVRSWGWLLHYPDTDPVMVFTAPESSLSEILRDFPGAISAEPFIPSFRQSTAPTSTDQEAAIRTWLAYIEETDPYIIADVLERCRIDADALDYFIRRAGE